MEGSGCYYEVKMLLLTKSLPQIKIKDNGNLGNESDYLSLHFEDGKCPVWPDDSATSLVAQNPVALDNSLYSYKYEVSYAANVNGSEWMFYIEPFIPWPVLEENDKPLQYSLLLTQEFICNPPCLHGGRCSSTFPNTCECTDAGYQGDRCEDCKFFVFSFCLITLFISPVQPYLRSPWEMRWREYMPVRRGMGGRNLH